MIPVMISKAFRVTVFIKGLSAVIAQTLLFRELLVVFGGNELTVSLMLCVWLLSSAAGSIFFVRFFDRLRSAKRAYSACLFLFILWLPTALLLTRLAHPLLGLDFGEVLSLGQIILMCFTALSVLAVADGAMFALAYRGIGSVSSTYTFECLGALSGGVLFTFVLVRLFPSMIIALLVCLIDTVSFALLAWTQRHRSIRLTALLLCAASLTGLTFAPRLQRWSIDKQWPLGAVVVSENSLYGNITATSRDGQCDVFYDGLPIMSLPHPDTALVEDFVHLTLLAKPMSRRVLFVGHAAGGFLSELLKYPLQEIVTVEPDPMLLQVLRSLPVPSVQRELRDPRVTFVAADPRQALAALRGSFDAAFVHTGLPTSLATNRTHTQDFFRQIDRHLAPDGILAVTTWGSLAFMSEPLKRVNADLMVTLQSVFAHVEAIPGDAFTIFLASQRPLTLDPRMMSGAQMRLALSATLINPTYLELRLNKEDRNWFKATVTPALKAATPNTDLRPSALYDALALTYAQFSKKLPRVFSGLGRIKTVPLAALFICYFFVIHALGRHRRRQASLLKGTVFTSGFFSMSAYMTTLLIFQSFLGILYAWLGLLTAVFMAGAASGAVTEKKLARRLVSVRTLIGIEFLAPALVTAIAFLIIRIYSADTSAGVWGRGLFVLTGFLAGYLVGIELPVVHDVYRRRFGGPGMPDAALAGQLYGLDLAGACLGVFVTPLWLIPSCGIRATLVALFLLKAFQASALLPLTHERRKRPL